MYAWEAISSCVSKLVPGQPVCLNPEWSGYAYLKQEFGKMFPSYVKKVNSLSGTVTIEGGGEYVTEFARQCLISQKDMRKYHY